MEGGRFGGGADFRKSRGEGVIWQVHSVRVVRIFSGAM